MISLHKVHITDKAVPMPKIHKSLTSTLEAGRFYASHTRAGPDVVVKRIIKVRSFSQLLQHLNYPSSSKCRYANVILVFMMPFYGTITLLNYGGCWNNYHEMLNLTI
jgi:hypothetical protein